MMQTPRSAALLCSPVRSARVAAALVTLAAASCAPPAEDGAAGVPDASAVRAGAAFAACRSLAPSSTGGAVPTDPGVVTLRWLGTSNYELAHRGQVLLLDAFLDRGPGHPPVGVAPADVRRVDAILVGHAHWDHVSDAPELSERTGARVVGAPTTIEYVRSAGVPEERTEVVRGGEVLSFEGFTVEAILARHNTFPEEEFDRSGQAYELMTAGVPPLTEAERTRAAELRRKGSGDPRIRTEGTIAYLFTFESGFKLLWTDSPGPITDAERSAAERAGPVDLAVLAYQGPRSAWELAEWVLPKVELYRPRVVLPAHHDQLAGVVLDVPVFPLATRIRSVLPETRTLAPEYRAPVCAEVASGEVWAGTEG